MVGSRPHCRPCERRDPYPQQIIVGVKPSPIAFQKHPPRRMGPCVRRDDRGGTAALSTVIASAAKQSSFLIAAASKLDFFLASAPRNDVVRSAAFHGMIRPSFHKGFACAACFPHSCSPPS